MSKKNKALGIGNAIVDAVCKVNESFLKSHNLQKGTMKLIDNNELKKIQNEIIDLIKNRSLSNELDMNYINEKMRKKSDYVLPKNPGLV